jgi:hypothetical protein
MRLEQRVKQEVSMPVKRCEATAQPFFDIFIEGELLAHSNRNSAGERGERTPLASDSPVLLRLFL